MSKRTDKPKELTKKDVKRAKKLAKGLAAKIKEAVVGMMQQASKPPVTRAETQATSLDDEMMRTYPVQLTALEAQMVLGAAMEAEKARANSDRCNCPNCMALAHALREAGKRIFTSVPEPTFYGNAKKRERLAAVALAMGVEEEAVAGAIGEVDAEGDQHRERAKRKTH